MAKSDYAHITPEMVERACQITRAFFTGREQPQENTASTNTRGETPREATRTLPLFEAPETTRT